MVPFLGAVRLRDLTPEVLDECVGGMSRSDTTGKRRLGPTSARLVRKVLSMALEEAVQRGRLGRNPVSLTQPPRKERTRQTREVLALRWEDVDMERLHLEVVQQLPSSAAGRCSNAIGALVAGITADLIGRRGSVAVVAAASGLCRPVCSPRPHQRRPAGARIG